MLYTANVMSTNKIEKIELDETSIIRRSAVIDAERASAIRDLLNSNTFAPISQKIKNTGPYHVKIGLENRQLILRIKDSKKTHLLPFSFSLTPYRSIIKDYFIICESYQTAFGNGQTVSLETIDMARRALHNEGAQILQKRFARDIEIDFETARSLFTLICILHLGGKNRW